MRKQPILSVLPIYSLGQHIPTYSTTSGIQHNDSSTTLAGCLQSTGSPSPRDIAAFIIDRNRKMACKTCHVKSPARARNTHPPAHASRTYLLLIPSFGRVMLTHVNLNEKDLDSSQCLSKDNVVQYVLTNLCLPNRICRGDTLLGNFRQLFLSCISRQPRARRHLNPGYQRRSEVVEKTVPSSKIAKSNLAMERERYIDREWS
jgi:hypothetical protein